jgi:hypothetical protein
VLDTDGAEFTGRCADVALAYVTHDQRLELVDVRRSCISWY